jgi:beta-galactosidase
MNAPVSPRRRVSLDRGWRFSLGHACDRERDFGFGEGHTYAKAGRGPEPTRPRFKDQSWRVVDLPHDWGVELPFDESASRWHGYRPLGRQFAATSIGWYRRVLDLPESAGDRRLWIELDGVFRDALVWVNGVFMARNESGYVGFAVDVTDVVQEGENILTVRVDATHFEQWSYEGAGIYRHVWLLETAPVHVARYGTQILSDPQSDGTARVRVLTRVVNQQDADAEISVAVRVFEREREGAGPIVADAASERVRVAPGNDLVIEQDLLIESARLWSPASPSMYLARTEVRGSGEVLDAVETPFGVRTVAFDAERGFLLNGEPLQLRGTCNHQDHAGVGIAVPDRLAEWRVASLKEMGSNALRTSHHPPAPELLDACDRMGMLVLDEHRMMGSGTEALSQLERMVLRDRNHPSVFLWCIGNEEEGVQHEEIGRRMAETMQRLVHRLDPTRQCTLAMNRSWGEGASRVIDVQGVNYKQGTTRLTRFHSENPTRPVLGTEEASTLTTRGEYADDAARGVLSAYPGTHPQWGTTAEDAWPYYRDRPWLSGIFVWTGFDYRGETTPYHWPAVGAQFGLMDLCGFPKDNYQYYRACWSEEPVLHVFPHWTWPGREGEEIVVRCFSNLDEVELLLNGKSVGRQAMPRDAHLEWPVRYRPGVLLARGFRAGVPVLEREVATAGAPAALELSVGRPGAAAAVELSAATPDQLSPATALLADGRDVAVVTVAVLDERGRRVPTACDEIRFSLEGPARLLGVGNGDPASHEPETFTTPDARWTRRAFNGLAQAIVGAGTEAGKVTLIAEAEGLSPGRLHLSVKSEYSAVSETADAITPADANSQPPLTHA